MPTNAERQIKAFLNDVERAANRFDKRDRKKVLRAGSAPVRKTARNLTPKRVSRPDRTDLNPRYLNGKIVAYYLPGNLRKAVRTLSFRRSNDVFVGPKFGGKSRRVYGRTVSSADGYYAAMLFGSAKRFRSRILEPSIRQNAAEVRRLVLDKARSLIIGYANR